MSTTHRRRRRSHLSICRFGTEYLEDRRLLAAVTVGNLLDVVNAPDVSSISALVANDGGDGISLREAINAANNTSGLDTVTFDSTVFTGGAASVIRLQTGPLLVHQSLHIDGATRGVVISADANGDDVLVPGTFITDIGASDSSNKLADNSGTVIDIFDTPSGNVVRLTGLTITGGNSNAGGGAVISFFADLVIEDTNISGNRAIYDGGGIVTHSGSVTLSNSSVSRNSSGADGGGISTISGTVTLTGSPVSRNSSGGVGGGISTISGTVTLTGSTVNENSSGADGGGVATSSGEVTLIRSAVSGNETRDAVIQSDNSGLGGGVFLDGGSLTVLESTISGNRTGDGAPGSYYASAGHAGAGAGVFARSGSVFVERSTVSGNKTGWGGGVASRYGGNGGSGAGIWSGAYLSVVNSTISGNSTGSGSLGNIRGGNGGDGGGILAGGTLIVQSSTITNNSTGERGGSTNAFGQQGLGGGIAATVGENVRITNSIVANSSTGGDLFSGDFGSFTGSYNLIEDGSGGLADTISGDPILGPLADNGGPTATHLPQANSPVLNGGDPNAAAGVGDTSLYDQRGMGFDRKLAFRLDIGAVESTMAAPLSLVVSTSDDGIDADFGAGQLSLREAVAWANTFSGADTITFNSLFDSTQVIQLDSQLPTIMDALTIIGPGANLLTIDAGNGVDDTFGTGDGFRIFNINDGDNNTYVDVTLSGLKLTGGDSNTNDNLGIGGAIHNRENLIVTNSVISGNAAGRSGGGLYNHRGTANITSSTISGNSANSRFGGGIYNLGGQANVTSSTISGNSASIGGGGIYSRGTATVSNSTVSGNSANFGGGLYNYRGTANITSSTISGNSASVSGGGVYNGIGGTATIDNSIVAGSSLGGDLSGSSTFSGSFNLIGDGNFNGLTGIDGDPLLGLLADNGGPTQTHALQFGSPAFNAGGLLTANVATGGIATQSSEIGFGGPFPADNAVDGDLANFTHTYSFDENPWWEVDLQTDHVITQVVLHNRGDNCCAERLRDITIDVFDSANNLVESSGILNAANQNNGPKTITFTVSQPVSGRRVRVSRNSDPNGNGVDDANVLSLGEVQIFGTVATDQRGAGFNRVQLGGVDIGAFELQSDIPPQGLVVSTVADTFDGDFSAGNLSLREAIAIANDNLGVDAITFHATVFATPQTLNLASQLPTITDALTVTGPGVNLIEINAGDGADNTFGSGDGFRVFNFDDGDPNSHLNVTLRGLTLTGGDPKTDDLLGKGGAIFNVENLSMTESVLSGNAASDGGGLYSRGTASVANSTISGNAASFSGGGIFSRGDTGTLSGSTISGNAARFGGGIYNDTTFAVTNSTISGNSASDLGGGIFSNRFRTVTLGNSTLSGNSAGDGGGMFNYRTTATVNNSIVANSISGGDLTISSFGGSFSGSFNLIKDGNFQGLTGIAGDPLLGQLQDNGGPTQTHALMLGSPAINAGDPAFGTPPDFDQRGAGFDRLMSGIVDLGAYELQNLPPVFTSPDSATVAENTQAVHTLTATDADLPVQAVTFFINGNGVDNDQFEIISGGQLQFKAAPDFENPNDFGGAAGDNIYEVSVVADDGAGGTTSQTIQVTVSDVSETPQVESVVVDNDAETNCGTTCQRSMVRKLTVTFDRAVNINSGAFTLNNTSSNASFTIADEDVATSVVDGKTVAVLSFANSTTGIVGGSLADGNYKLTIDSTKVQVGTSNMSANHTDDFFRFFGDVDGDRDVDNLDYLFFLRSYGSANPDGVFDFNGDGNVDNLDYLFFLRNYGRSV